MKLKRKRVYLRYERYRIRKAYNPKDFEDKFTQTGKKGYFKPKTDTDSALYSANKASESLSAPANAESFTVVIPPPNVTGVLHMGHGLNNALQDIIIRYHRMTGKNTLWLPGTDHAGIATQNVVERRLKKDGLSRHDLGREAFVKTWEVKEGIRNYYKQPKTRSLCDWSRERFTMDEGLSRCCSEVFVSLLKERYAKLSGNWCTLWNYLADDEVEHTDKQG